MSRSFYGYPLTQVVVYIFRPGGKISEWVYEVTAECPAHGREW